MKWEILHPEMTMEHLGFILGFFSEDNPDSAAKQIDKNYAHGGGWNPQPGFSLRKDCVLQYPGDPPLRPLARSTLRQEKIIFYPHAYVGIFQPDGSWEVARVD